MMMFWVSTHEDEVVLERPPSPPVRHSQTEKFGVEANHQFDVTGIQTDVRESWSG